MKPIYISIETLAKVVFISLLFMAAMNTFNKFYYFIVLMFLFIVFVRQSNRIPLRRNFWLLSTFSITYFIFFYANGIADFSINTTIKLFIFIISFIIGCLVINKFNSERDLIIYTCTIAFGAFTHGLFNFINAIKLYGFNPTYRNLPDIWTGEVTAATGLAAVFIIIIGISYAIIFRQNNKILKIITAISLIITLMFNMITASRTVFLLLALILLLSYIYNLFLKDRRKIKSILTPMIILVLCLMVYNFNIFNTKGIYENSPLYDRLNASWQTGLINDPRIDRVDLYLENMPDYLWGGNNMFNKFGYAHNLWLDIYDDVGIIPFSFLLLFSISALLSVKKFLGKEVSNYVKLMVFGLVISSNIYFFTEPIIQGVPWLFVTYCFFIGMIDKFNHAFNKNQEAVSLIKTYGEMPL